MYNFRENFHISICVSHASTNEKIDGFNFDGLVKKVKISPVKILCYTVAYPFYA